LNSKTNLKIKAPSLFADFSQMSIDNTTLLYTLSPKVFIYT